MNVVDTSYGMTNSLLTVSATSCLTLIKQLSYAYCVGGSFRIW